MPASNYTDANTVAELERDTELYEPSETEILDRAMEHLIEIDAEQLKHILFTNYPDCSIYELAVIIYGDKARQELMGGTKWAL